MRAVRALTLAALAAVAAAPAAAAGQTSPAEVRDEVGIDQRLGERLPLDARFVDRTGAEVRLGDVLGDRPVVLALVYYECPMLCTLVLNGLVSALRVVPLDVGEDYDVVAISIDPDETPELARRKHAAYVEEYGRSGSADGWRFLVGDEQAIAAVAEAAGFRFTYVPERDEYAHAAGVMVVTPDGELARYFYGVEYSPRDLRLALVEASAGRIGTLVDAVLLLCLHYDPTTGKYGFVIMSALRLAGGATLLVLGVYVVRMLLRERSARRVAAAPEGAPGS